MRARLSAIFLSLFAFGTLLLPQVAFADTHVPAPDPDLLTTVSESESGVFGGVTTACWKKGTCSLCDILVVGINISSGILRLLAIVATIFFVYGAALMMLSQGNEDYVSRGKATMKATIVGVIITICAWQIMSIVVFVLANAQAEGGANKLAVFEGTEEVRKTTTATYNPITSWFTIAEICNQGKGLPAPTPAPASSTPDSTAPANTPIAPATTTEPTTPEAPQADPEPAPSDTSSSGSGSILDSIEEAPPIVTF